ncbi:hypothetical protein SAMN04487866_11092 [Thermoactinomyces sp. DSM 45891]|nr:hypothetical protein [Thermoactinomyces sp. DSM 45891]SFX52781.1 hypothetical protein SAMN04487866_11092 [Thermoactinomyces sp. DSM 45891]
MWKKLNEELQNAAKKGYGNQINIATGNNAKIIATKVIKKENKKW